MVENASICTSHRYRPYGLRSNPSSSLQRKVLDASLGFAAGVSRSDDQMYIYGHCCGQGAHSVVIFLLR